MKSILAFGASSSRRSINKQLSEYAASQLKGVQVKVLDLNNFEMPLFSVDKEAEQGIPELAYRFKEEIKQAQIVSTASTIRYEWESILGYRAELHTYSALIHHL